MLKKLEKNFFNTSIKEIRENKLLKDLNLTDEEIIYNRRDIKAVLDSQKECSDDCKYCYSMDDHLSLKRNLDKKLIIVKFKCKKIKDYQNIEDKKIESKIKELLLKTPVTFTNLQIKKQIEKILNLNPQPLNEEILNVIKSIGDTETQIPCTYLNNNSKLSKNLVIIAIIYAYKFIISEQYVSIIESNELKTILLKQYFYFDKEENKHNYKKKYDLWKNIQNLIILDFGRENYNGNMSYYLDAIPEFLSYRKSSNKRTIIISRISWNVLKTIIIKSFNSSETLIKNKKEMNYIKLEKLEEIIKNFVQISVPAF